MKLSKRKCPSCKKDDIVNIKMKYGHKTRYVCRCGHVWEL